MASPHPLPTLDVDVSFQSVPWGSLPTIVSPPSYHSMTGLETTGGSGKWRHVPSYIASIPGLAGQGFNKPCRGFDGLPQLGCDDPVALPSWAFLPTMPGESGLS